MSKEIIDKLDFLLVCRVKDFHEQGYADVTVDILKDYLLNMKWKNCTVFLHEMAKEVQALTYFEVIDYLRLEHIFHAKEESLQEIFSNLI